MPNQPYRYPSRSQRSVLTANASVPGSPVIKQGTRAMKQVCIDTLGENLAPFGSHAYRDQMRRMYEATLNTVVTTDANVAGSGTDAFDVPLRVVGLGNANYGRSNGSRLHAVLHFASVNVPKDTVLISATISGTWQVDNSGVNASIYGQAVDNASGIDDVSNYPSDASWNDTSASTLDIDDSLTPHDVTSIVQELINRAGWVANNNLNIVYRSDEASAGAAENKSWTVSTVQLKVTY